MKRYMLVQCPGINVHGLLLKSIHVFLAIVFMRLTRFLEQRAKALVNNTDLYLKASKSLIQLNNVIKCNKMHTSTQNDNKFSKAASCVYASYFAMRILIRPYGIAAIIK